MEAAAGAGCGSGPPLPLSEGEQQCYSELFARCAGAAPGGPGPPDAARAAPGAATAAAGPVADLFRASQLPAETLHQITELCGAKRVGYFGPTQFYVALKLIAAAQSGLPVRLESIKCELPLPRFVMSKNDGEIRFGNLTELHGTKVQIPYLTTEKNSFKRVDDGDSQQEAQSPTMSPLASPPSSPLHYQRVPLSHGYSKLRSGAEQMHPAPYEGRQPLVQLEGLSSAGPGTKPPRLQASLIRSFSVEREPQENISNYPDEPWRITEEQREYYVSQFRSLQPDPSSFISGSVAKNFFTKSKLSIPELSYIWELSDADCDGALTLPEFCAAFHLIVARKNGYPLPEGLPPTLQPEYLQAAAKSGLLPPPPALPPRPCPSQVSHHSVTSEPSAQPKPPVQLPNYGDFRLQEQSEQASEAELHPPLTRIPSQAAESSPAKKPQDMAYSQPPSKPIRRKFRPENQAPENQEPSTTVGGPATVSAVKPHPTVQKQSSKQKKAIQTAIRKNKEANVVLARLNSELQQQLKEVHQERIALENQLEQLRPVTVL
ncbi:ralBP1-associated Eps domain-containing protein 2 isoform X13 [Dasypus novemcinctus]|uniref:ralBP1-associated Eps domain-containing protein 2 isoform X13 n=1 Tax=Dasypus novemcinctus TaxID=9361 RepID=UPI00265DCFF7|nr:ralBP1-associated Eps domain-containing protein 2 isoform X12 [Dasypus novemcinctus]